MNESIKTPEGIPTGAITEGERMSTDTRSAEEPLLWNLPEVLRRPRLIPQVILKSNIYGIRKRLIFERLSMGRCNFGGYSVPHVSERYNR